MNDTNTLLLVESQKKRGIIAALLNLLLPGAGYAYCGRWILGIFAFLIVVGTWIATFGLATVGLWLVLIIDGFLCADRYNKRLIKRVLAEQASKQS